MKKVGQNGFTLIEFLIFSVIFGIVIGAIYMMYSTSHTTFTRGQNKIDAQQNGRVAMERMAREIRTAGYDPSDVLNNPPAPPPITTAIQTANLNNITFLADVEDLAVPCAGNSITDLVTYRLNPVDNTQLMRDISSSWDGANWNCPNSSVLADGVSALTFTYCDGSDVCSPPNPLPPPLADVRRITIQLTTEESGAPGTESFPLSMDVRLRNLQ